MLRLSLPLRLARIRRTAAGSTARSPRFRLPRSFGLAALLALVALAPAQEAKAQWAVIDPAHIAKSIYNGRQILNQLQAQRDQLLAFRENVRKLRSYNVRDVGGLIDQFDRTIVSGGQLAYTSADLAREFDRTYRSFDVNDPAGEARRVLEDRLSGSLNTLRALREHATQLQTSRRDLQGFQSQIRSATTAQQIAELQGTVQAYQAQETQMLRQVVMLQADQAAQSDARGAAVRAYAREVGRAQSARSRDYARRMGGRDYGSRPVID